MCFIFDQRSVSEYAKSRGSQDPYSRILDPSLTLHVLPFAAHTVLYRCIIGNRKEREQRNPAGRAV